MFCKHCGAEINDNAVVCIKCGCAVSDKGVIASSKEGKDWLVALLLSIFTGYFGVDRFYLGYIGLGVLKLLTVGGCGVWALIDIILIATSSLKDAQGNPLVKR